jgi:phospholipid N-methyltransferase
MVDAAQVQPGEVVVELGAGTGPITRELLSRSSGSRVIAVEPNPSLAAILRGRFVALDVAEQYAQALPHILATRDLPHADCIISSLPWAIWPARAQAEVFEAVLSGLRVGGRLVMFSYLHLQLWPLAFRFKRAVARRFGRLSVASVALANLPPAMVLRCTRGVAE